jgi:hypothetical protein
MMQVHARTVQQTQLVMNAMSLELTIISALAGIAIGLRYKVIILVPAVALVMTFAMMVGFACGDHFWPIFSTITLSGTAIQLGYLAGISIRGRITALDLDAQAAPLRQALSRHARQEAAAITQSPQARTPLEQSSGQQARTECSKRNL